MSWRRLYVLLRYLPAESACVRIASGETADWRPEAHLLALLIDAVNVGNWQRSGRKGAQRPKPVLRPGMERPGVVKFGGKGMPPAEFDAVYKRMLEHAEFVEIEPGEV